MAWLTKLFRKSGRRTRRRKSPAENVAKSHIARRKVERGAPLLHLRDDTGANAPSSLQRVRKKTLIKGKFQKALKLKPIETEIDYVQKPERKRILPIKPNRQLPKGTITIYENPFQKGEKKVVIDKKKVCNSRKEARREIFRKSAGMGISVKQAKWNTLSKIVRC